MRKEKSNIEVLSGVLSNFTYLVLIGIASLLFYSLLGESLIKDLQPSAKITTSKVGNSLSIQEVNLSNEFVLDEHVEIVRASCTSCHSSQLVTQNRATKEGWKAMIKWMQETQGLPDLGLREVLIVKYLAKNYGPVDKGRRKNIEIPEGDWYELDL